MGGSAEGAYLPPEQKSAVGSRAMAGAADVMDDGASSPSPIPSRPQPPAPLWHDRTFRALWAGQTASLFGDQVTGLALPWLILLQTHSSLDAGLVAGTRYLPTLVLGLVAGVVADRFDRRRLMLLADLVRCGALGVVVLLGVRGISHRCGCSRW